MSKSYEKVDNRTQTIMEKWGVDGELDQQNVKHAAESYQFIKARNRNLKWIAFGAVLFMLAFLGLMLASVVIGIDVTKELKVKNNVLMQNKNNKKEEAIKTSEMLYNTKIDLMAPLQVIQGLKSLKFTSKDVDGNEKTLQFNVVSFYFIRGRELLIYGHNQMAKFLGDGSVEVYPINIVNGVKNIDVTQRNLFDDIVGSTTSILNLLLFTPVYTCSGLQNIKSTGLYVLTTDLECTLSAPLEPFIIFTSTIDSNGFQGTLNGNGHVLTLHMDRNGVVGLFRKLKGATIVNLLIDADMSGEGSCGVMAVESFSGSKFLYSAVYGNLTCTNDGSNVVAMGGFSARIRNPSNSTSKIKFDHSVSQVVFHYSQTQSVVSYQAGFYGMTGHAETVPTEFTYNYFATLLNKLINNNSSHANSYGYKYAFPNPAHIDRGIQKRDHIYVPEDCYNYATTTEEYINMCVGWYVENYYEHQICCVGFDSCPYINCDVYTKICMMCRPLDPNRAESKQENENTRSRIIPGVVTTW